MTNPSPLAQEFYEHGRVASCPVIDVHTHPGPLQGLFFPNAAPERMIETMDRCGVRLICAVSHSSFTESGRGNAFTEQMIEQYPGRVLGYWMINPNYPERARREVEEYPQHKGFIGFKFLADYHRYPITGDAYAPALEYAEAHQLKTLLHTWGGSPYDSPRHVEALAKKYPHVTFIAAHCGYGEWDYCIGVGRDYPNVYLDITGTHDVYGIIERLIAGAGADKILFGTDLPWFDPRFVIGCVLCAHISDEERHAILHRNAERLLGL